MSLKERTINVDIMTKEYTKIKYKQGDSNQTLKFKFYKNGSELDLTGYVAGIFYEKPNNEVLEKTGNISSNTVTTTITSGVLNTPGVVKTEIFLTKNDEVSISFTILIEVESSIDKNAAVQEKEEWDIIKDLLIKADNIAMIDDSLTATNKTWSSSKISSQIKDFKNSWMKNLNSNFIAHKGFNGTINTVKSNGIAPLNSAKSFNLTGELGFKIVEFDVNILADGTWVIEHDNEIDTDNTYTSKVALDTLTLEQLKQYEMYRAYIGLGYYWQYGDNNKNYKIMTLEEGLKIVKKYDMFALIEIKFAKTYQYNDDDLINLANTIKKVGMENKSILFTAHEGYLNTLMSNLPKSIAGLMLTSIDNTTLDKLNKYQNYLALCDTALFDNNINFFIDNNIPVAVWTIDDYELAEDYVNKGANFIISNYLIPSNNRIQNNYTLSQVYSMSDFSQSKGTTSSITEDNGVLTFITDSYANLYKNIDSSMLCEGDIIKISCEGKTNSSNNVNYARMSVSNNGGNYLNRNSMIKFKTDSYELKTIYYVVDDKCESVTIRFGCGGNGLTGQSDANIKNIRVEIFRKNIGEKSEFKNERFAKLYAYDNAFLFRSSTTKYGITSVDSSGTELVINYEPFISTAKPLVFIQIDDYSRDFKYHVIPVTDNETAGQIKLKIFDDSWNQITTLSSGLRLSFSILIKNLE